MKNERTEFGSQNRLKKILSSAALCAMMTTNLAGAATYDVSTVAAKGIGDGLGTSDFNSIVDTLKGWVLDDQDTNDGADDTATFAGDICNGSGDCLSDAMNASAGGKFVDGATVADAVFTGGNVGIGTDSPQRPLHISNPTVPTLIIEDSDAGENLKKRYLNSDGSGGMAFGSFLDDMSSSTKHMTIASTGNVGIGTDDPGAKLEIKDGSIYLSGGQSSGKANIILEDKRTSQTADSRFSTGIQFKDYNAVAAEINLDHNSYFGGAAKALTFDVNSAERVRINHDGNVGIGTTTPTEKLEVAGKVKAQAVVMEMSADKGNCDVNSKGTMVYEEVVGEDGVFYGCMKRADDSYSWVNLQVFGQ